MQKKLVIDFEQAASDRDKQEVKEAFAADYGLDVKVIREKNGRYVEVVYDDQDEWADDFMAEEAKYYRGVVDAKVYPH